MTPLPLAVHTAAQVSAIDRYAIDVLGIPGYTLMSRAGEAALALLRRSWPSARCIVVICGPGNNGGDGYVLARLARERRLDVKVVSVCDTQRLRGDAARACQEFLSTGGVIEEWSTELAGRADVFVDAIFGIGLSRAVDRTTAAIIEAINSSERPVFAIDIPSGLHADTGAVLGVAIRAERTVTFVGLKLGFYVGRGPDHVGALTFEALELPFSALQHSPSAAVRVEQELLLRTLPARPRTSHKGEQGDVLIIGGNIGMAGAVRLAGEAALRSGAGRVTIATRHDNVAATVAGRPELMCRGVEHAADLNALMERADIVAIGPGLGQDEWATLMLNTALARNPVAVLDADALNLLAQAPRRSERWILTPHPGEAARLLGTTTNEVQSDRLAAAHAIARKYGGVVVLKGAGSLVVTADATPSICDRGNPGMASPGMGDVLTGVIAGIAAQIAELASAARAGVLVHAMSGDMAARRGERGMVASDLFAYLPTCVNPTQSI